MKQKLRRLAIATGLLLSAAPAGAQTFAEGDSVLRKIWTETYERSQLQPLAQTLLDSIGPRLTGSPGMQAASDWAVGKYREWGIPARQEQYGTWRSWRRGVTHADLVAPRVRSLEATMLAWSPGTRGAVEGAVVALPESGFSAWLPSVRGKYVLISAPQPTCRPDENLAEFARPQAFERLQQERTAQRAAWARRVQASGLSGVALYRRLEAAGAAGFLTSSWSGGWGVDQIHRAYTESAPMLDVSCEDYGLLARLALNGQGPVLRVQAEAEFLGERPVFNTVAEIRGAELPNEYVLLSAHFDSWDAASGATDNGTGTVTMMEVMRILKTAYPRPRRTILVGHWSGEEQGLDGSEAFRSDHPEIVAGLQALLNQDTGTGRVTRVAMHGLARAGSFFERWLARVPTQITEGIRLDAPGAPRSGGSDYSSFLCTGAPAFELGSLGWGYNPYTWHTNRDTYDKISWDDLRSNTALIAMLAYMAADDPQRIPRDRTPLVNPRTGAPTQWPACEQAERSGR
ncbi:MAG: M28 family peptidase [Gemmatimonadetes bacterium]|nr:M28 family peptidase [Gemmatimonadota bacterium]